MPKALRICSLSPLVLALFTLPPACRHAQSDGDRPETRLSSSGEAQTEFRALRAAWFSGGANERRDLEPDLRNFLAHYPQDEQSDVVRVLLAFDCVSRGSVTEARSLLARVREPAGTVHDFSRLAAAYARLREGDADAAWSLLEPLAGKIIDPDERLLFSELCLQAAIEARRYPRAAHAAEELLNEAPAEPRGALEARVKELFERAPKADLLDSLKSFDTPERADESASPAREWLMRMLRGKLVELAVRDNDAQLARLLLDSANAALRASESGAKLAAIASGGRTAALILGRSVGLVLALGSADLRRRSASVAAGLSTGLGLTGAFSKQRVHLISRDDGGTENGTLAALRELSAQGAAILVAGMDSASVDGAAKFSEQNAIPVLLVQAPRTLPAAALGAFVLGTSAAEELAALQLELKERGIQTSVSVGAIGNDCGTPPEGATGARFPTEQWRRDHLPAVVLFGSARCAAELARELRAAGFAPALALSLEAAEFVYSKEALPGSFALGAGLFPSIYRPGADADPASPALDWYEALGHDAALLSQAALVDFPDGRVDDARAVRELYMRATRALAGARAPLWTSEAAGFSGSHVLTRTLRIVSPEVHSEKPP